VEFMISPGRGEPAKPIARIASGGELARLMLALKIVLARADEVDVLVFDEVDAGIGGLTAGRIGEKMARLAEFHQVITVTHLPQIAACAGAQFRIVKEDRDGRLATGIQGLDEEGRRVELARMLGGTGESALRHADELLKSAAKPAPPDAGKPGKGRGKRQPQKSPDTLPGI
jgi:DNA repair protein RecN (Recombination protein N)